MTIFTTNKLWGTGENPLDRTRTVGGSSGGDAGLVSAKCVPMGIGSDLGGSLRIPAAFTGTLSFKPTCGRTSLRGNRMVLKDNITLLKFISASAGPIGNTVSDLITAYRV